MVRAGVDAGAKMFVEFVGSAAATATHQNKNAAARNVPRIVSIRTMIIAPIVTAPLPSIGIAGLTHQEPDRSRICWPGLRRAAAVLAKVTVGYLT
jgi:hypothetical protein